MEAGDRPALRWAALSGVAGGRVWAPAAAYTAHTACHASNLLVKGRKAVVPTSVEFNLKGPEVEADAPFPTQKAFQSLWGDSPPFSQHEVF